MSRATSPSTRKCYGLSWVAGESGDGVPAPSERGDPSAGKRGPKGQWANAELLALIRADWAETEWVGEAGGSGRSSPASSRYRRCQHSPVFLVGRGHVLEEVV